MFFGDDSSLVISSALESNLAWRGPTDDLPEEFPVSR